MMIRLGNRHLPLCFPLHLTNYENNERESFITNNDADLEEVFLFGSLAGDLPCVGENKKQFASVLQ